jgi:hypothetical protein
MVLTQRDVLDITEILLKVALNTINQTIPNNTIYLVGLKGVRLSDTVDMEDCSLSEYLSTVSSAKQRSRYIMFIQTSKYIIMILALIFKKQKRFYNCDVLH